MPVQTVASRGHVTHGGEVQSLAWLGEQIKASRSSAERASRDVIAYNKILNFLAQEPDRNEPLFTAADEVLNTVILNKRRTFIPFRMVLQCYDSNTMSSLRFDDESAGLARLLCKAVNGLRDGTAEVGNGLSSARPDSPRQLPQETLVSGFGNALQALRQRQTQRAQAASVTPPPVPFAQPPPCMTCAVSGALLDKGVFCGADKKTYAPQGYPAGAAPRITARLMQAAAQTWKGALTPPYQALREILQCSFTCDLLAGPVVTCSDGNSYSKEMLHNWRQSGHLTSPNSRAVLSDTDIFDDPQLTELCRVVGLHSEQEDNSVAFVAQPQVAAAPTPQAIAENIYQSLERARALAQTLRSASQTTDAAQWQQVADIADEVAGYTDQSFASEVTVARLRAAEAFVKLAQWDEAQLRLALVIRADPDSIVVNGQRELVQQDYRQALGDVSVAGLFSQTAAALRSRGEAHLQRGDLEQAEASLRKSLEIAADSQPIAAVLQRVERSRAAHRANQAAQATALHSVVAQAEAALAAGDAAGAIAVCQAHQQGSAPHPQLSSVLTRARQAQSLLTGTQAYERGRQWLEMGRYARAVTDLTVAHHSGIDAAEGVLLEALDRRIDEMGAAAHDSPASSLRLARARLNYPKLAQTMRPGAFSPAAMAFFTKLCGDLNAAYDHGHTGESLPILVETLQHILPLISSQVPNVTHACWQKIALCPPEVDISQGLASDIGLAFARVDYAEVVSILAPSVQKHGDDSIARSMHEKLAQSLAYAFSPQRDAEAKHHYFKATDIAEHMLKCDRVRGVRPVTGLTALRRRLGGS